MAIQAMILDVDGTLIDTNPAHVEAWHRAFDRLGFDVPRERIIPEIGKGGDKLVPSVLGREAEEQVGDTLREIQNHEFLAVAKQQRFRVFSGAEEIFSECRKRGIRTAIATSSNEKHLTATLESAKFELQGLADVIVTRTEDESSKPSPDLVEAAVEQLGLPAADCVMVGDTVYDGQACKAAGVAFLGVLTGPATEAELLEAGARGVWNDIASLAADLDRALDISSPAGVVPV
ncbi:MAG TPA: HAD family hydrolase [Gemmatimonadales bacterium]|nr:HAD family hydrolase [Gemmatimonadales bacterium]